MDVLDSFVASSTSRPYDVSMGGSVHVGTSGYSFNDWVGIVYPPTARPPEFLGYYARWFDTVEINATYYRIPPPQTFEAMRRKVGPDFLFTVKLPKEMTHERDRASKALRPFLDAIAPVRASQQLGGVLAQFPTSFHPGNAAWDHIERITAPFVAAEIPIHVEFRHRDWYTEETITRLQERGVGFVNVDLPPLAGLPPPTHIATTDIAYYRLHGRNAKTWWRHPTPSDRYDYLYAAGELATWAADVERVAAAAKTTFVFHNNCHLGQSVVNALELHQRFGLARPPLPPGAAAELLPPTLAEQIRGLRARIAAARS